MAKALNVPQKLFSTQRGFVKAVRRIEATAKLLKLSPGDTQACIWAGQYRITNGTYAPYFPILAEYQLFQELGRNYPEFGSIDNHYKLFRKARFDSRQRKLFHEVA